MRKSIYKNLYPILTVVCSCQFYSIRYGHPSHCSKTKTRNKGYTVLKGRIKCLSVMWLCILENLPKKNKLRKSGNKLLKLRNDLGKSATYSTSTPQPSFTLWNKNKQVHQPYEQSEKAGLPWMVILNHYSRT